MAGFGWQMRRLKRGDIGPLILVALLNKPMHGYEVISYLEERSHGLWRPSAGAIYPNLQMLEEQGLVSSKEEKGKKIYELTEDGRKEAEIAKANTKKQWENREEFANNVAELKAAFGETIGSLRGIAATESKDKIAGALAILKNTRNEIIQLMEEKSSDNKKHAGSKE
jgi:DNA-binding PadR family transcriptional regulator